MTTQVTAKLDTDRLIGEIQLYLAALDVFRAEGREPRWCPEQRVPGMPRRAALKRRRCT
jgi:hypothetical protein